MAVPPAGCALMRIPEHVLRAFQVDGEGEPTSEAWGSGLRFGRVVIAPAQEDSAWSAKVRERVAPDRGVRLSRPVRATDGRFVVGGFAATEFAEGAPAARVDEVMSASLLIDAALHSIPAPATEPGEGSWRDYDRAVWAGEDFHGEHVVADLDLLRRCLFDGSAPPFVSALTPSADVRPRGYTAALVMVDGLLADAVDAHVVQRWAHIPHLRALAGKALEFRQLTTPQSNIGAEFRRVAQIVFP